MAKVNVSKEELFGKLLGSFKGTADPFRAMFEWLTEEMMDAEMLEKIGAGKYERGPGRKGHRAGKRSKPRRWDTRMGTLSLSIPKPRNGGYVPSFLSRGKRSERALCGVIMEAFVQGVSTRKMEKVMQAFGIKDISAGQVSNLCEELDGKVKVFLSRRLRGRYPYVWVDALYEKIREDSAVTNHAAVVAIGVNELGHREILGLMIMPTEDIESWKEFLRSLVERGLTGVKLIISDKHLGIRGAIKQIFNDGVMWQRCKVHTMRNILCRVKQAGKKEVANALKAIFTQASGKKAKEEARRVIVEYKHRFPEAMMTLENAVDEMLTFYSFPQEHWKKISSTNPLERLNREARRRTRVVGVFPSTNSCLRLLGMVLLEQHDEWLAQTYMDTEKLKALYESDDNIETVPLEEQRSTPTHPAGGVGTEFTPALMPARELVLA